MFVLVCCRGVHVLSSVFMYCHVCFLVLSCVFTCCRVCSYVVVCVHVLSCLFICCCVCLYVVVFVHMLLCVSICCHVCSCVAMCVHMLSCVSMCCHVCSCVPVLSLTLCLCPDRAIHSEVPSSQPQLLSTVISQRGWHEEHLSETLRRSHQVSFQLTQSRDVSHLTMLTCNTKITFAI